MLKDGSLHLLADDLRVNMTIYLSVTGFSLLTW